MQTEIGAVPMDDPIAYFITWSTYGTWLPGDERGWVEYRHGWKLPDPIRELEAAAKMTEDACYLSPEQRDAVEKQVAETCGHRGWTLHEVNCRTNHLHVVVTARAHPKVVRSHLKAWCTRKLKMLARCKGPAGRFASIGGPNAAVNDTSMIKSASMPRSSTYGTGKTRNTNPKRKRGAGNFDLPR